MLAFQPILLLVTELEQGSELKHVYGNSASVIEVVKLHLMENKNKDIWKKQNEEFEAWLQDIIQQSKQP